MAIQLPPLPYPADALEPIFPAAALRYHHERHHGADIDALNRLLKGTAFEAECLDTIAAAASGALAEAAASAWNHTFYWSCMTPHRTRPAGQLLAAIERSFGSTRNLATSIQDIGLRHDGDGWLWLVAHEAGDLELVVTTSGTPLGWDAARTPLLACDLWDHAYDRHLAGDRTAYLAAFWHVIDWDCAAERLARSREPDGRPV